MFATTIDSTVTFFDMTGYFQRGGALIFGFSTYLMDGPVHFLLV